MGNNYIMDGQKEDHDEFRDVEIDMDENKKEPVEATAVQTEESIGLGEVQINLEAHPESKNEPVGNEVEEKKAAGII